MKKLFTILVLLVSCMGAFAAGPNLQDITLISGDGETLDFYADRCNMVVYHASESGISRNGTFYLGSTISSQNGYVEAKFSIELPMSYGLKELSGTIYYRVSNGSVSYVTLDGTRFSSSQQTVVPRRRGVQRR